MRPLQPYDTRTEEGEWCVTLDASGAPVASTAPLDALEARSRPAVTSALADALGADPTVGPLSTEEALKAQRSAAADPLYDAWRATPVPTTPSMADLMQRPTIVDAIRGAQRKAADQGRSIFVSPAAEAAWERDPIGSGALPELPADAPETAPAASMNPEDAYMDRFAKPTPPDVARPQSARDVIRRLGGVRDSGGDLASGGVDEMGPGIGNLLQPANSGKGVSADEASQVLAQLGYFGADTEAAMRNRSTSLLSDALTNHPTYPEGAASEAWAAHDADMRDWQQWNSDTAGLSRHSDLPMPGRSPAADYSPEDMGLPPGPATRTGPAQFTAEGLDTIKQHLDDKIQTAQRGGQNNDARIYTGLNSALTNAVDNHPDPAVSGAWADARRAYAVPSGEIDALSAGRRAMGDNVTREDLGRQFADLATDGERQQFRNGAFSALSDKLARRPDGGSFVDAVAGTPALRDKLGVLASSPEALDRFHGAMDQARQTFTEATRPDVPALHGALRFLDDKVARGADEGVTAARDALAAELSSHPDFARGRGVETGYNKLLGALDDGKTALRGGSNALHPDDFAESFAARTPAEQAATRIGMRAEVDSTLRQRVGDVEALRNKLMGTDGFNADKIGTAFGQGAPNRLQAAVDRERAFADTEGKIVHNSKSTPSLLSAERLKASRLGSLDLSGVTSFGAGLQTAKSAIYNPIVRALLESDNAPRDLEIARALTAQGAGRDQILSSLARVEAQRGGVALAARRAGAVARSAVADSAPSSRPLLNPTAGRNKLAGFMRSGADLVGAGR